MTDLQMTPGVYHAPDGCKIYLRSYRAPDEKAGLVLAHGLGEHSGRYQNVVAPLLEAGISVWLPDHRGHGQSDGQRGHVDAFDQYLSDLKGVMTQAQESLPGACPCFLLGHSMGGLSKLPAGVIVSSPALGLTVKVPAIKNGLGKIMSTLWPRLSLGNELDPTKISHDADVVAAYIDDPLVHDRVSARWFTEFIAAMATAHRLAPQLKAPLLMQLAGDDHMAASDRARSFFDSLPLEDKTFFCYDDLYHEIYNAPATQRTPVINDLIAWLTPRIGKKGS
jgi:lysophospholipase